MILAACRPPLVSQAERTGVPGILRCNAGSTVWGIVSRSTGLGAGIRVVVDWYEGRGKQADRSKSLTNLPVLFGGREQAGWSTMFQNCSSVSVHASGVHRYVCSDVAHPRGPPLAVPQLDTKKKKTFSSSALPLWLEIGTLALSQSDKATSAICMHISMEAAASADLT